MKKSEFCDYINQYRSILYTVAYTILANEADAEDAVSSAIQKGYEHLDQLKSKQKFKPWIITITKNEALQMKQKRMLLPGDEQVEAMLHPVVDQHDELWDVVQKLPEQYRLVIVLFYYDDLPMRDISKILDISLGTVKSRLKRGRDLLKAMLGNKR